MTRRRPFAALATVLLLATLAVVSGNRASVAAQGRQARGDRDRGTDDAGIDRRMTAHGRLATLASSGRLDKMLAKARAARKAGGVVHDIDPRDEGDDDDEDVPTGGQAETSIAVDATGQHVVVGINDTRGFGLNPVSVSGFTYSDDGGVTFTDGGTLPVTTATTNISGSLYPQVFGDPEVKYLGGSTFIYFSIVVARFPATGTITGTVQTMGFHRSTDYGHTWQGPFIVTPASNPHGQVSAGAPVDAADKEFADVDPDTGRVLMTWSNFTTTTNAPGGVEISSTFSDSVMAASPTWSTRKILAATATDGQMSVPRFARGSPNAYAVWGRFTATSQRNIGFARSTDNGTTWGAAVNIANDFTTMDEVLGNDRQNNAPSLAVDTSAGAFNGNIYVTYANNNNLDGADIVFQRSTNQGGSFSTPIRLDRTPGSDRAQWFPWVTVDRSTGRVYVFYYDQGYAPTGDLTETMYVYSDDGGATFMRPLPLTDRPFHAAYGNDTGQPNLGDYNQAVAQNGELFAVWAASPVTSLGFTDGQPSASMTMPDVVVKRVAPPGGVPISGGQLSLVDSGGTLGGNGFADPGEQLSISVPLTNYVNNPLNRITVTGLSGVLHTVTPGVVVTQNVSNYPQLAPGATAVNPTPFLAAVPRTLPLGSAIDFWMDVESAQGAATLWFTVWTGTPRTTTLLSENFDAGAALPAGWTPVHAGGNNTVAWTTRTTALGASPAAISRAAFHVNANDGLSSNPTRTEQLRSPAFTVPAGSEYVTVDFDVAYDTEDDAGFNVLAYDGVLLRLIDATAGNTSRAVAVEAFAQTFTTGAANFYPKHLARQNLTGYFQDLSAWAGDSRVGGDANGFKHVHLQLPGMAGTTALLDFEYTQDNTAICSNVRAGHQCGVLVDNVVVQSVRSKSPSSVILTASAQPTAVGAPVVFTATVTAADGTLAADGTVTFMEGATVLQGPVTVSGGQVGFTTSALALGSHTITAAYTPGASGTITAGSATIVENVLVAETIGDVSIVEGSSGIQSMTFTVSLSQPSPTAIATSYATHDGTATIADFDYGAASGVLVLNPGETAKTITVSVFGDTRFEPDEMISVTIDNGNTAILTRSAGTGTIVNDDPPGPTVDDPTVQSYLGAGATRLQILQNADGGWYFAASATSCGHGAGVSCPNTFGVTALALTAAFARTHNAAVLANAIRVGDAIVQAFNAMTTPDLPYTPDIEFLVELAQLTGNDSYRTVAASWFQILEDRYQHDPAYNVDQWIIDRDHVISHGARSLAAWDVATLVRAAKAVNEITYAAGLAARIREREPDWKDTNPAHRFDQCADPAGCGPADNRHAFDYTIAGEGSLLWAIHDLPGADAQINEYRTFLLANQDPIGTWDGGDLQQTAYIVLGLAAVGGSQANAAIRSAAAVFIANMLPGGGWPSAVGGADPGGEFTEIDGEIVRALATVFNTPVGSGVSVTPAQYSSLTFGTVSASGMTSVFSIDGATLPALPAGYTPVDGLTYRATTTALVSGNITMCFTVPWIGNAAAFGRLRVLQRDSIAMVDRTITAGADAPDFARRRICALTTTLEPFAIAMRDSRPPTITVSVSPAVLWPPNGRLVTVNASIEVHDDTDAAPRVRLVSITDSAPDPRRVDVRNAVIGTDDRSFDLRAAAGRRGAIRVYTIHYRATDAAGNSAEATAQVQVGKARQPDDD